MSNERAVEVGAEIMAEFAQRTGLTDGATPPRRYLWTDAFAVCNFLELHRATGGREPLELALRLVEQVHATLGRYHPDDSRSGWISGLDEDQGRAHPTRGGLRIGKPRPERGPHEPFDERSEWDRDGQYFHYLTRWMHALGCVARVTGERRYLRWALELARAAHAGFTWSPPGARRKRLCWKMSVDLTRTLVPSMGQHDPLDGLLTLRSLCADALQAGLQSEAAPLREALDDLRAMCAGAEWATADALGLGGLLCDALRLARLALGDAAEAGDAALLAGLVDDAARGLRVLAGSGELLGPAARRLAFRELGLAIGLEALPHLVQSAEADSRLWSLGAHLEALRPFAPLVAALVSFWLEPASQVAEPWRAHLDINAVMLATSLMPWGYLAL